MELQVAEGIRVAMPAGGIAVCGFQHGLRQLARLI
jgi:hypothetical protein